MSKYSIVVKEECIACGACAATVPEIFSFDDDGYAENIFVGDRNTGTVEIPNSLTPDLSDAAAGCPTEAIKIQSIPFTS